MKYNFGDYLAQEHIRQNGFVLVKEWGANPTGPVLSCESTIDTDLELDLTKSAALALILSLGKIRTENLINRAVLNYFATRQDAEKESQKYQFGICAYSDVEKEYMHIEKLANQNKTIVEYTQDLRFQNKGVVLHNGGMVWHCGGELKVAMNP